MIKKKKQKIVCVYPSQNTIHLNQSKRKQEFWINLRIFLLLKRHFFFRFFFPLSSILQPFVTHKKHLKKTAITKLVAHKEKNFF